MGIYDTFETDLDLETNGVWIDYGDCRILIASAGQGNKKYVRYAEKKLKPVRRDLNSGAMGNARSQAIMADIYAVSIVLDWKTEVDGKLEVGIESKEQADLLPFNQENVKQTLILLPRLFLDLQEQAGSLATFRKEDLENDTKNS